MRNDGSAENLIDDKSDSSNEGNKNGSAASEAGGKKYQWQGKELTADEYFAATQNLNKDYTETKQKLSELERKNGNQSSSDNSLSERDQEVIRTLKAWGFTQKEDVEQVVKGKEDEIGSYAASNAAMQIEIKQSIKSLEKEFDGSEQSLADGSTVKKPKVDGNKILDWLAKHGNPDLSIASVARLLYQSEFSEYDFRIRTNGFKSKMPQTEGEGTGHNEPNQTKKAPSFNDGSAEDRMRERLGVQPRI